MIASLAQMISRSSISETFQEKYVLMIDNSQKAGPKVAAIFSVVECCRRLGVPIRQYLLDVPPGLLSRSTKSVVQLIPAAHAANCAK